MATSTSSSFERARSRRRVERNRKRDPVHRSRSKGRSNCSSSEEEKNDIKNRTGWKGRRKDHRRSFYRDRQGTSSYDRSRRRKRSPSPSPTRQRRKKIRTTSDNDSPHSRSRKSHIHSHSQCKHCSDHKHHRRRSGSKRHETCCCVPYHTSSRVSKVCSKRKERDSRSLTRSDEEKVHRSRSRESINHGSNSKSLERSKARRQTSCDVNVSHENAFLATDSDSLRKGNLSGNCLLTHNAQTKEGFQSELCNILQSRGSRRESALPLLHPVTDPDQSLVFGGGLTLGFLDGIGNMDCQSLQPEKDEDLSIRSGHYVLDVDKEMLTTETNDWLDLSLKAPPKPTPKIEGISREDLRLSLDSSLPAVLMSSKFEGQHAAKSLFTSTCNQSLKASFCSNSSSLEDVIMFEGSLVGGNDLVNSTGQGGIIAEEVNTSTQKNMKNLSSFDLDNCVDISGPPEEGHKKEEEKCFFLLKKLISIGNDKTEVAADLGTSLPDSGVLGESAAVKVSGKQGLDTVDIKPVSCGLLQRGDKSVIMIDLSNSLSAEEDDAERAELSVDSADLTKVKETMEACPARHIPDIPLNPSPPTKTSIPSKSRKTSLRLVPECSVVQLSDSTMEHEDEGKHDNEVQSQHSLPVNFSQSSRLTYKLEPLHSSEDPPAVGGSCPIDTTTQQLSPKDSHPEAGVVGKQVVRDLGDLHHAPDLYIEKVRSSISSARPPSPPDSARTGNSSPPVNRALPQQSGSKHTVTTDHPSTSRFKSVDVVELSDSSSENASDESDDDFQEALSTKCSHVRPVRDVKTAKSQRKKETPESSEEDPNEPSHYLNEDVVCCATKPPLKKDKEAYVGEEEGRVRYMRDKHGNLIQVVDVDDSEDEDDDELDINPDDKDKDFFSSCPQVRPVIQEIKEMLQGDDFNMERSDGQLEPDSPLVVKSQPPTRTQFQSRAPSQRVQLRKLVLDDSDSPESDEDDELVQGSGNSPVGPKHREKWRRGVLCDLCCGGPSLSLGEWYCWCCGRPATKCQCPEEMKTRKLLAIGFRKEQKQKKRGRQIIRHQWSGKVHRMCALWSSEVYLKSNGKKGPHFAQLDTAVKRGNSLTCKHPDCKKTGATLGCRVRTCRRSYHYPCAEKLANQCLVRMWDGALVPIACQYHRHVEQQAERARDKMLRSKITDSIREGKTVVSADRPYIGDNLLCKDIAEGQEQVQIPCTNDVDGDPAPSIRYITKCWFKGRPVDHLHPVGTELAKGCQGCAGPNFDNPHTLMPIHVMDKDKANRSRESDDRRDWQGERMYGRLPYNSAGLLQLGPDSKDINECNSRCKCGHKCKNRELQKGLQCSLEVFKTKDRGWGVRALEQIPRGKFVVEYVGDVLSQAEADERGEQYDQNQLSYLFNLDHPKVKHSDAIVLDGITMSNIARFINHSCEGNLMIFRVFSETNDLRYFRIGMYAIEDIEVGDELSYDYNYALSKDSSDLVDDPTAIRCFCGAPSCRKWLWQGGH